MRLPRMTTRRWMIAVVLAALILWAARLLSLSAAYREQAIHYQGGPLGSTPILMGPIGSHSVSHPPSGRRLWAQRMAEKYLHASRFPWLPVEPDTPEPK
jgi:hypothetical protein